MQMGATCVGSTLRMVLEGDHLKVETVKEEGSSL